MILVASVARLEFGFALGFPNALAARLSIDNSTIFTNQLHLTPIEMDLVGESSLQPRSGYVTLLGRPNNHYFKAISYECQWCYGYISISASVIH